jgi:hypothetical protein
LTNILTNTDLWTNVLIGVLSSLVASVVFLLGISRITPKIAISPHLCEQTDGDGQVSHYIKLVNRSRRPVANIKLLMTFATSKNVPGGTDTGGPIHVHERIELRTYEILGIPGLDKKDLEHRNAVRLRILTNLDEAWKNENVVHIRFQVYATDSFTGFGKVFEQKYYGKQATLKRGTFQRGDSFEVV